MALIGYSVPLRAEVSQDQLTDALGVGVGVDLPFGSVWECGC